MKGVPSSVKELALVANIVTRTKRGCFNQNFSRCKKISAAKKGIKNATKHADPSILVDDVNPLHNKLSESIRDTGNGKYAEEST
jgi:hypothetical protein